MEDGIIGALRQLSMGSYKLFLNGQSYDRKEISNSFVIQKLITNLKTVTSLER